MFSTTVIPKENGMVLRDHKGTRATQERRETKASQVNRDPQENWDLKGPQAGRVPVEPKVMQGIKEAREPQASGVLQELSGVIGNSVFSNIWTMERTLA